MRLMQYWDILVQRECQYEPLELKAHSMLIIFGYCGAKFFISYMSRETEQQRTIKPMNSVPILKQILVCDH